MRTLHTLSRLALGLMAAAAVSQAHAQGSTPAQHDPWQARYQADLADCDRLNSSPEAVANCRREAAAAHQSARKGEQQSPDSHQLHENTMRRCRSLPVDQQEDCMKTMRQGGNTQTFGSVSGGGILRRTEIIIPGEPVPAPAQPGAGMLNAPAAGQDELPRTGRVLP